MKRCITCGRNTKEFSAFPCAKCGKEIIRCTNCRKNGNDYKCECGFQGP